MRKKRGRQPVLQVYLLLYLSIVNVAAVLLNVGHVRRVPHFWWIR